MSRIQAYPGKGLTGSSERYSYYEPAVALAVKQSLGIAAGAVQDESTKKALLMASAAAPLMPVAVDMAAKAATEARNTALAFFAGLVLWKALS